MSSPRSIVRAAARRNPRDYQPQMRNIRRCHEPVYIASSLSTYDTPRYAAMLTRLRDLLPDAELLSARDLFTCNADWLRKWPEILPTLAAVVFFDDRGSVGLGVYQEVEDAQSVRLPVFYLPHPAADLMPYDGEIVRLLPHGRSWAHYADVVYMLTPDVLAALGAPADVVAGFAAIQHGKGGA